MNEKNAAGFSSMIHHGQLKMHRAQKGEKWYADYLAGRNKSGREVPTHFATVHQTFHRRVNMSNYVSDLAIAQIKDALRVLGDGFPKADDHGSYPQAVKDYLDTQYWIFEEDDEGGERAFSLAWCCDAIHFLTGTELHPLDIREECVKKGWKYTPKTRRQAKIISLTERRMELEDAKRSDH